MTQVRFGNLFYTDIRASTLYVQQDLGLKTMTKIKAVADLRFDVAYTTVPVPAAELRKIMALRQQSKSTSRNGVSGSNKPTPPGQRPNSQLTRTERRLKFKIGFAPLADWWPQS